MRVCRKMYNILRKYFCFLPLFLQIPSNLTPFSSPPSIAPSLDSEFKNSLSPIKESLVSERMLNILDYWFGSLSGPEVFPENKIETWFAAKPEIHRELCENFSKDFLSAVRGELNSWRDTPRGRLALILLLDQFPRHIYRNKPQAFMSDPMARGLVLEGIRKEEDKQLYPIERAFFYLPLEHAEDAVMQQLAVNCYRQLLAETSTEMRPVIQDFLQHALIHQQQINRFGRFPHRNPILGRESTPEEIVFLNQWGKNSL